MANKDDIYSTIRIEGDDAEKSLSSVAKEAEKLEKYLSQLDKVIAMNESSIAQISKTASVMQDEFKKTGVVVNDSGNIMNNSIIKNSSAISEASKNFSQFNKTIGDTTKNIDKDLIKSANDSQKVLDKMDASTKVLALSLGVGLARSIYLARDQFASLFNVDFSKFSNSKLANSLSKVFDNQIIKNINDLISKTSVFFNKDSINMAKLFVDGFASYILQNGKNIIQNAISLFSGSIGGSLSGIFSSIKDSISQNGPDILKSFYNLSSGALNALKVGFEKFKLKNIEYIFNGFATSAKNSSNIFNSFFNAFNGAGSPGYIKFIESITLMPGLLGFLGASLLKSENSFTKLLGVISLTAAALSGGITVVIGLFIGQISRMAYEIGDKLTTAMEGWEKSFAKAQEVTSAFTFTLQGFTRIFGEKSVGAASTWQKIIENINSTTNFTTQDIQKSIKILIAEGSNLGISAEQNYQILKRSADIAANSQTSLADAVFAVASAFGNNAQSLQSYGIYLNQNSLDHSEYAKKLGMTFEEMNHGEQIQARFNELMRQSEPLIGSASNSLNTLAGSHASVEKAINQLEIELGSQSRAIVLYNRVVGDIVKVFASLPKPIIDAAGVFIDFGGVLLKIIGTIGAYTLPLLTLITIHKTFSFVMTSFATVQAVVAAAFNYLTTSIVASATAGTGATTIFGRLTVALLGNAAAATTATAVYSNLIRIVAVGAVAALQSMFYAIGQVTLAIGRMTLAILSNPLFWKAVAIATLVYAVVKACMELYEELGLVSKASEKTGEHIDVLAETMEFLASTVGKASRVLIDLTKTVISGLAGASLLAARGVFTLMRALSNSAEEIKFLDESIEGLDIKIGQFSMAGDAAFESLAGNFVSTAVAADAAGKSFENVAESLAKINESSSRLDIIRKSIDAAGIRMSVLGDDFDRLAVNLNKSKKEAELAAKEYKRGGSSAKEALDKYKTSLEEVIRTEAEMGKLRKDSFKKIKDFADQGRIELLKSSGQNIQAINEEFALRRIELQKEIDLAKKAGNTSSSSIMKMSEAMKILSESQKIAIENQKAEDFEASLKPAFDMLSSLRQNTQSLNNEILTQGASEYDLLVKALEAQLDQIEKVRRSFGEAISGEVADELAKSESLVRELARLKMIKTPQSDSQYKAIKESGQIAATSITSAFQTGTLGMVFGALEVVDAMADAVLKIIDFIPSVINKVADVFNKLTDLPAAITKAFSGLSAAILRATKDFAANVIKMVSDLPDIILSFVDALPYAIGEGALKFADALLSWYERLPDVFTKTIANISSLMPKIWEQTFKVIIDKAPDIAWKMIKLMAVELPIAIVKGIIKGIEQFGKSIINIFSGKVKLPKVDIDTKAISSLGKKLSGETSKLFNVKALTDPAQDAMTSVANTVVDAFKKGENILLKAWKWINDNIIKPIGELLTKAWTWINETIIKPIASLLQNAFSWIKENIFDPFISGVSFVFNWINEKIFQPLYQGIMSAFRWVYDNIFKPFVDFFTNAFQNVVNGFMSVLKAVINPIIDLFNALKIPALEIDFKVLGKRVNFQLWPDIDMIPGNIQKLAQGGLVTQSPYLLNGMGTDTSLLAATPGEFMVSRRAVQSIGVDTLSKMNKTGKVSANESVSFNFGSINITTSREIDAKFIKDTIVPQIKAELKKASNSGEFLISKRGVQ